MNNQLSALFWSGLSLEMYDQVTSNCSGFRFWSDMWAHSYSPKNHKLILFWNFNSPVTDNSRLKLIMEPLKRQEEFWAYGLFYLYLILNSLYQLNVNSRFQHKITNPTTIEIDITTSQILPVILGTLWQSGAVYFSNTLSKTGAIAVVLTNFIFRISFYYF